MSDVWLPEARPVPVELTEDFEAPPYNDPFLGRVMDRYEGASMAQLMEIARGGIGEPSGG